MRADVSLAMVLETLADLQLLQGVVYGLIGVGIWVGGLLFFNWLWHYFRDDDGSGSSTGDNV